MATAARTIIETPTPGWFLDPSTGKKTRKQEGDRVLSRTEYDALLQDEQAKLDSEPSRGTPANGEDTSGEDTSGEDTSDEAADAEGAANGDGEDKPARQRRTNGEHREQAAERAPVMLTSGKLSHGQTTTIRCAWVDSDKRTEAQQALFAQGPKAISYDAVKDAAGGKRSAFPDGREVVIQKQDAFQVRFHPENQRKWRAELRRHKNKARRDAARKAAEAQQS